MTRGAVLLAGLGVFILGGAGFLAFRLGGFEGFSPGIAASSLLMVVVLAWTASYLFRVVSGRMTYMEQRRRYRAAYDAATDAELQARFDALSPAEQTQLLAELGQIQGDEPTPSDSAAAGETLNAPPPMVAGPDAPTP